MDRQFIYLGNKAIAKFMELEMPETNVYQIGDKRYSPSEMLYPHNWDWAMTVLLLIEHRHHYSFELTERFCQIGVFRTDFNETVFAEIDNVVLMPLIESVYRCILKFVHFKNSNKL